MSFVHHEIKQTAFDLRCALSAPALAISLVPYLFLCLIPGAGLLAASPSTASFSISSAEVERGAGFNVPIRVSTDTPLSLIAVTVEYDRQVLEFIDATVHPDIQSILDQHPQSESKFQIFRNNDEESDEGKSCLLPSDSSSDAEGELKIEDENDHGDDDDGPVSTEVWEIRLKVSELLPRTQYEFQFVHRGSGSVETAATFTTEDDGRGEVDFDTNTLPFGATNFAELEGIDAVVVDANGAEILRGPVPGAGVEFDCDHGSAVEEDWFQLLLILDRESRPELSTPTGTDLSIFDLQFRVLNDAAEGEHTLEFSTPEIAGYSGNFGEDLDTRFNVIRNDGQPIDDAAPFMESLDAELQNGFIFVAQIIGEVGIFSRGDADLDNQVTLVDPLRILFFKFEGFPTLQCPEAADADQNGSVGMTDAFLILSYLFLGGSQWQPSIVMDQVSSAPSRKFSSGCYP